MSIHPTAAQRVDWERNENVRSAATTLFRGEYPGIPRTEVRAHVVAVMLASVEKQARWSAGLETTSG